MSKRNREAKRARRERKCWEKEVDALFSVEWEEKKESANNLISWILCQTRSLDKLPDGVLKAIENYFELTPSNLRSQMSDIDIAQTVVEIDCIGGTESWGWETKEDSAARTPKEWAAFVRSLNPVQRPSISEVYRTMCKKDPSLNDRLSKQPDFVWQPA